MNTTKIALILVAVMCGHSAFAGDPTISDVMVRQRWPWSKLVDIDYVLTDTAQASDIVVKAFNGEKPLTLPLASLSGDLYSVSDGAHRIVWDPTVTAYTNTGVLGKFSVGLSATNPPLYMIVDLTMTNGATDQIEYVYEADLHAGTWGSCVTNPVSTNGVVIVESLIWTGVTNDTYKTTKLVLRRVPTGTFMMMDADLSTTLTKACYAGVFVVTEAQWGKIMGSGGSSKPMATASYNEIRGATTSEPSVDWPNTDRTVVAPGSFLAKLRSKTGISDFDLPTEAQWEYLCRAGTTTYYNDGLGTPLDDTTRDARMNVLGWYKSNCTAAHPVGEKAANAWGLYDMHGNVWELCLDWSAAPVGGNDPSGAKLGSARVLRGGSWDNPATSCRSTARYSSNPSERDWRRGFRLVRTLP